MPTRSRPGKLRSRIFNAKTIGALTLLAGLSRPAQAQTTYTWNDTAGNWTTASAWTPAGPDWTLATNLQDSIANFGNVPSIGNTPTIGNNLLYANGVVIDNSGADWTITGGSSGVLALGTSGISVSGGGTAFITTQINIAADQTWTTADSTVLRALGGISGAGNFTKAGNGSLAWDGPSSFIGTITVTGGIFQAGNATSFTANRVLRSNSLNLGAGTLFTSGGVLGDVVSVGALSGSGHFGLVTTGGVNMHALESATFSGCVSNTDNWPGLFEMRGANVTQTFSGNLAGQTADMGFNSGITIVFSGGGDGNGVGNMPAIYVRGGGLVLDNSGNNTTRTVGRFRDTTQIIMTGGRFTLIGNATDGTTEAVGLLTLGSGSANITVEHNGGASGTALTFTNSGNLRFTNGMTVNFVGTGGTLGSAGANPRITFGGSIFQNTSSGMLATANGAASEGIGWARVNTNYWAGVDSGNNIIALSDTLRDSANLTSAGGNELVDFAPSIANTAIASNLGVAALKISPTGPGQQLSLTSDTVALNTNAIMLTGSANFTIDGGQLGRFGSAVNNEPSRYIYVTDPNAVLTMTGNLAGQPNGVVKSGPGVLSLEGASNQFPFATLSNITIAEGILRATPTALGGGAASGGANTTILMRGGILEINGGGAFTRAVGVNGNASGGSINFYRAVTAFGDGGFSAINGNATVTLTATPGSSTATTLQWQQNPTFPFLVNGAAFLLNSDKADSRIEIANPIALDSGASNLIYFAREFRVADNGASTGDYALLSQPISGSRSADLLKTGAGRLELAGNNTYGGNTLIFEGTLTATGQTGSQSATGTGAVKVFPGATLNGTGQIIPNLGSLVANRVIIEGTIAPGESVGTILIGSSTNPATITMQGGIYDFELAIAGSSAPLNTGDSTPALPQLNHDLINGNGAFDFTGSTLNITSLGSTGFDNTMTYSWRIASTNGGTVTGLPTLGAVSGTDFTTLAGGSFSISSGSGNLYLNFQTVPEPASMLLFAAAGLGVCGYVRRRAKRPGQGIGAGDTSL